MPKAKQSKLTKNPIFQPRDALFFEVCGRPNKKAPLPSVLILRTLKLFNHGKNWTKGELETKTRNVWNPKLKKFMDDDFLANLRNADEPLPKEVRAYCAMGGIEEVNTSNSDLAGYFLAYVVDPSTVTDCITSGDDLEPNNIVFEWNDDSERTWPEVEAKFKEAAKFAKSLGC